MCPNELNMTLMPSRANRWSVGLSSFYGKNTCLPANVDAIENQDILRFSGANEESPVYFDHLDVVGIGINLSYSFSSRFGMTGSVLYSKMMDRLFWSSTTSASNVESFEDNGYSIAYQKGMTTVYNTSNFLSSRFGIFYHIPLHKKFSLRLEGGFDYNFYNNRFGVSDLNSALDNQSQNLKNTEISSNGYGIGFYTAAQVEYKLNNRISLAIGANYVHAKGWYNGQTGSYEMPQDS